MEKYLDVWAISNIILGVIWFLWLCYHLTFVLGKKSVDEALESAECIHSALGYIAISVLFMALFCLGWDYLPDLT